MLHSTRRIELLPLSRLITVTICVIYAVALIAALQYTIAPRFAYMGFNYHPLDDAVFLVWTWSTVVLAAFCLPIRVRLPGDLFAWLLYILVLVPSQLIPPYASGRGYDYAPYQFAIVLAFAAVCGVGLLPRLRFPHISWAAGGVVVCLALYTLLVVSWIILVVGVPTSIPSITNPYAQRTAFDAAVSGAGVMVYLMAWQVNVVNPAFILLGLTRRNWMLLAAGIGLNVLIYSLAGHKSHLLSSVLVVAMYVLFRLPEISRGLLIASATIAMIFSTQIVYWVTGNIFLPSIFVRRLIMVPGLLTGQYHQYFSEHSSTLLFGPLSGILGAPEPVLSTPLLIGEEYQRTVVAANANMWADAFSAMGYAGIGIATIILIAVLWLFNSFATNRERLVIIPLAIVPLFSLMNSALPTSLLTHGILASLMLMALLPASTESQLRRSTRARAGTPVKPILPAQLARGES